MKQERSSNRDTVFTIDCKNILLREYQLDDLEPLHELTHQPEIVQYLPGWNVTKEQRLHWMANYELKENRRFLQAVAEDGIIGDLRLRLGVILKETGEFIGWCCTGTKEELPSPNREIVYALSAAHRNKGYATQAVQGLIRYLFENTDVELLNAIALLDNLPSQAVIQKCGFDLINQVEIQKERYNHYILRKQSCIPSSS